MSKQTNAFQKLIHYIHEKMEGNDATVTESASLLEQGIKEKIAREVDVLIEKNIDGEAVRIAIECRDRASIDDIQWVDCLIGKYQNLDVHKVIAVSNSGYSSAAQLKAKANGIKLMTLQEAMKVDFSSEFTKLGMLTFQLKFKFEHISLHCEPRLTLKPTPDMKVVFDNGFITSLDELVLFCFKEVTGKKLDKYFDTNFLNIFKLKADLDNTVLLEDNIHLNNCSIQLVSEGSYKILSITLVMTGKPIVDEVVTKHRTFESALITEGNVSFEDQEKMHTLFAVQFPRANEGKVFVKTKPKTNKSKK